MEIKIKQALKQFQKANIIFEERKYEPPFIQLLPINEIYFGDRLKIQKVMGNEIEFIASIDGAGNVFRINKKKLLELLEKL